MSAYSPPQPPTTTTVPRKPSGPARRFGYVIGIAVNAVLLYLVNVAPGWQSLSFVTPAAADLVGLLNLCLGVGLGLNIVYVIADPRWLRALGDAVNAALGVLLSWRVLEVFPFDFSGWSFDWSPVVRAVLIIAIVGGAIALVVNLTKLVTSLRR